MKFLKSKWSAESLKRIKSLKKDQLVILLLLGVLLIVIAIPVESGEERNSASSADSEAGRETDLASGSGSSAGSEAERDGSQASGDAEEDYEQRQERRLREVLSLVEGVGEVQVMITLEAGSELVVEKDQPVTSQTVEETDSGGGSRSTAEESWSESTVYSESGDGSRYPYIVKELEPVVRGVVVIAGGGGDAAVRQNILEAVQALFPVEAHKIKIMKMEGSK